MKKRILSICLTIAMVLSLVTSVGAADPTVTKLTVGGVNALTTASGTNWSYDGVDTLTLSGDVGTISATGDLKIRLESDVTITTSTTSEPIMVYGSLTIDATGHTLTLDAVIKNRIALHVARYNSSQTGDLTVIGGKVAAYSGNSPIEVLGTLTVGEAATLIAYYDGSPNRVALTVYGNILNNGNIICNAMIRFNNSHQMITVTNNGNLYYAGNNWLQSSNLTILNHSLTVTGVTAYDTVTDTVSIGGSEAVIDVKGNAGLSCNLMIPEGETATLSGGSLLTIPAGTAFTNQGTLIITESTSISGTIIGNQPEGVGYVITFDANVTGSSWLVPKNIPAVQNVAPGNKATEPEDPIDGRDRYIFIGWYTDPECTEKYDFDAAVTKSMTLYAKWGWRFTSANVVLTPDSCTYSGVKQEPSITVELNDSLLTEGTDYTVSWDKSGFIQADTYTVTITGQGQYSGMITETFNIAPKEIAVSWGGVNFLPYTGQLVLPEISATDLVDGDTCEVLVSVVETADGAGIDPGKWTAKITGLSNGNYKLPENSGVPLEAAYTIYAQQTAPDVSGVAETIKGKNDGYISGLTTEMEYATEPTHIDRAYTRITDPDMTFAAGTYYVRYAAKDYYYSSPYTAVTVAEGRKLTVTLPQTQVGYTLTVDKTEFAYNDSLYFTFTLHDGYTMTDDFIAKFNGTVLPVHNGDVVVDSCMEDAVVTVAGIADITPPAAEIKIADNRWTSFWNNLTFGLFFKETQDVTITADDAGSGVKNIQYYLSDIELECDEVRSIVDWNDYNRTFKINPDNRYVIYAKVTDHAGNVTYINSEGMVLDATAPVLYGIEDGGVYHGDKIFKATDDNFLKIEVDGVDITDTTEGDDEFKIAADNAEHTVTVTDNAGNVTEYTVTVYKRYTVTFTNGNDEGYDKEFTYGEVITIPTSEFFKDTFRKTGYTITEWQGYTEGMTMPLKNLTFTAVYTPNNYTVEFDTNGGEPIAPITVTFDEKYGRLPSSAITGLSGSDKNWYLVDADGNVTDTNIRNLTLVSTARDHRLFVKRNVLAPSVSVALTVPGGISDKYSYYIPGASQRILTATVGNLNTDILDYTYRWYKDGTLIEGATSHALTLDGNVSDSGTYKVEVTAKLKDGTNIAVGSDAATASKEQKVTILHATNTLKYDANGGEGDPQSSYTGGTALNVSKDVPIRAHYHFIGWNTASDGTGDSYAADDVYLFADDNGNGGCVVTLYAQWKIEEHTVIFMVDGEPISTETVAHNSDATRPAVPAKDGYVGKWNSDGKNITEDTTICAVYTQIPVIRPDEMKPEDKAELEDTRKQLEDMLEDDAYTEDDKKKIQEAIDRVDGILAALNKPAGPDSPATGDNSNLWLWIALLLISGTGIFGITLHNRKNANKR